MDLGADTKTIQTARYTSHRHEEITCATIEKNKCAKRSTHIESVVRTSPPDRSFTFFSSVQLLAQFRQMLRLATREMHF